MKFGTFYSLRSSNLQRKRYANQTRTKTTEKPPDMRGKISDLGGKILDMAGKILDMSGKILDLPPLQTAYLLIMSFKRYKIRL